MREGLFHDVSMTISFVGFLGLNWVNLGILDPGTGADTLSSKGLKVMKSNHGLERVLQEIKHFLQRTLASLWN